MKSPRQVVAKTQNNVRMISGDGEIRKPSNSPLHRNANAAEEVEFKKPTLSPYNQRVGAANSRMARQVTESEQSFDTSPLHPQSQVKTAGVRASGVPSSYNERQVSSENNRTSTTPGRNLPRQVEQAVVPKFGDWDDSNPSAADGLTEVFEIIREERRSGGKIPAGSVEGSQSNGRRSYGHERSSKKWCGCFPFGGK